ncbi:hypothetical protein D0867_12814 [Hortaea werneckii]|uniref:Altered inheritance of mitochondria protein 21 n=2 Tax=Hortaea werneckii TaxID=91943 RepID=A0A3M6Y2R0_HORWE|nr:hypothetical protein KC334_g8683 [Hortaea werneckii]RMX97343.1 hypothetical protein D0867_12814 [Hortaea werneckii]
MSAPVVPPRPQRAQAPSNQEQQSQPQPQQQQQAPQIPPRPIRKTDPSPDREAYTRSPLNFPPPTNGSNGPRSSSNLGVEPPRRPPSIALPEEVGQEGLEYTSYDQLPAEAHKEEPAVEEQKRNVGAELPMHAPKASLPQSAAKSRIQTVTRTDSSQAEAAGIGKARPHDDSVDSSTSLSRTTSREQPGGRKDHLGRASSSEGSHPLRPRSSFNRSSPHLGTSPRPGSAHGVEGNDHEEGIPEIGQQIPLYPNAGDVQAPSPAPTLSQHTPGIGFWNDGSQRAHHRKRSSRHEFGPPGSYGLHGHGPREPADQFERDWIAKHPEEAAKEGHTPFMLRPESALSSEQLNRMVHENRDVGMGTSPAAIGTPSQDIAFEASDQFASRIASPKPSPAPLSELKKRESSSSHQPQSESPLRKTSFPFQADDDSGAIDSEADGDDVIHVDPPVRRGDKITGGGAMDNTVDLGPTGGNTKEKGGWIDERGDGVPILASDEITKRPGSAFLEPAISPDQTRSGDDDYFYDSDQQQHPSRRGSAQPQSRPTSRPNSMHGYQGGSLHRFVSHDEPHTSGMGTPLEEIEEYEPLFPEDDDGKQQEKPKAWAKRPGLAQHHFPSQDVWEDTPSSLQYMTTVETPEPPREKKEQNTEGEDRSGALFETPDQEQKRQTNDADMTKDSKTFAKPHFRSDVAHEMHHERPSANRFPSRDIWEDTPDSMRLVTTVSSPQMDETKSPPEERPTTAAIPGRQDEMEARSTTSVAGFTPVRPNVPARPQRSSKLAQEVKPEPEDPREEEVPDLGAKGEQLPDRTKPQIPERPKPTVPARPARGAAKEEGQSSLDPAAAGGAPLSKTPSASSGGSGSSDQTVTGSTAPAQPKTKPAVPARPMGSKIAALQAGFMSDLNNRLRLGQQGPPSKPKEQEEEAPAADDKPKEPLADARKGRARGPARRKPANAAATAAAAPAGSSDEWAFSKPTPLWSIAETDGALTVSSADPTDQHRLSNGETLELERELSRNEEKNTQTPTMNVRSNSLSSETAQPPGAIGAEGDIPPVSLSESTVHRSEAVKPEFEAALRGAELGPGSAEEMEKVKEGEVRDVSAAEGKSTKGDGDGVMDGEGGKKVEPDHAPVVGRKEYTEGDGGVAEGE